MFGNEFLIDIQLTFSDMLHCREWAEWTGPSGFDAVCLFCDCSSAETSEILTHMTVHFVNVNTVENTELLKVYEIKYLPASQLHCVNSYTVPIRPLHVCLSTKQLKNHSSEITAT